MKKTKSQKILPWKTKDIVLNVITYIINTLLIGFIFIGTIYLGDVSGRLSLGNYFANPTSFFHFFVLLVLLVALMAIYFFFEDRDFLKNAVNSEMVFLIIIVTSKNIAKWAADRKAEGLCANYSKAPCPKNGPRGTSPICNPNILL